MVWFNSDQYGMSESARWVVNHIDDVDPWRWWWWWWSCPVTIEDNDDDDDDDVSNESFNGNIASYQLDIRSIGCGMSLKFDEMVRSCTIISVLFIWCTLVVVVDDILMGNDAVTRLWTCSIASINSGTSSFSSLRGTTMSPCRPMVIMDEYDLSRSMATFRLCSVVKFNIEMSRDTIVVVVDDVHFHLTLYTPTHSHFAHL